MEEFDISNYPGLSTFVKSRADGTVILREPEEQETLLSHVMLRGTMRDYIIEKVKTPLMKAVVTLSKRFPEPTRKNCINPNTLLLMDIFDKFLKYEDNPNRIDLFIALFRIIVAEYEHDPYYRSRMNFLIEELVEAVMDGKWKPRGKNRPIQCWEEPEPFGLYEGRRFKSKITRGE